MTAQNKPAEKEELKGVEKVEKVEEKKKASPLRALSDLFVSTFKIIIGAVQNKDSKAVGKAARNIQAIRHRHRSLGPSVLLWMFEEAMEPSPLKEAALEMLRSCPPPPSSEGEGKEEDWPGPKEEVLPVAMKSGLAAAQPELLTFLCLLSVLLLLDCRQGSQAFSLASSLLFSHVRPCVTGEGKGSRRPCMDFLGAKVYFYWARFQEMQGGQVETRNTLLSGYRSACLHGYVSMQCTLLNLLLRSYLNGSLVDQASKLISKSNFPEERSNAELARFLFYSGRVRAVQMDYSEAHSKLSQALRKAPAGPGPIGRGFRSCVSKFLVVVELLMGDIPTRATFGQEDLKKQLEHYKELTEVVRSGDVEGFRLFVSRMESTFEKDGVLTLVRRLYHSVIKTGLRAISNAYSRILLSDVQKKLSLGSVEQTAAVAAKAITDGVIEARIDAETGSLVSGWKADLYSTSQPQRQMHKRIEFCLQLYQDAVKAMQYPDDSELKEELEKIQKKARDIDAEAMEEDDDDVEMF